MNRCEISFRWRVLCVGAVDWDSEVENGIESEECSFEDEAKFYRRGGCNRVHVFVRVRQLFC